MTDIRLREPITFYMDGLVDDDGQPLAVEVPAGTVLTDCPCVGCREIRRIHFESHPEDVIGAEE